MWLTGVSYFEHLSRSELILLFYLNVLWTSFKIRIDLTLLSYCTLNIFRRSEWSYSSILLYLEHILTSGVILLVYLTLNIFQDHNWSYSSVLLYFETYFNIRCDLLVYLTLNIFQDQNWSYSSILMYFEHLSRLELILLFYLTVLWTSFEDQSDLTLQSYCT